MEYRYSTRLNELSAEEIEQLLATLPATVAEHVREMHHLQGQRERTATYLLLVELLKDMGEYSAMPLIGHEEKGRPMLENYAGLNFSQSHCKGVVAVAIDKEGMVGIDVEGRRKVSDSLIRKVCSEAELKQIAEAEDGQMEFIRIWTRKEAFLKCIGTGIQDDMLNTEVQADEMGLTIESIYLEEADAYISICHRG